MRRRSFGFGATAVFSAALVACLACAVSVVSATPQCVSVRTGSETRQIVDGMTQMSSDAAELSFMQSMIRMDIGAVEISKQAAARSTHTELSLFVRRIVDRRVAEANKLVSWILALYGDAAYSASKPLGADSQAVGWFEQCNCGFEAGYILAMIRHEAGALAVAQAMLQRSAHGRIEQTARRIAMERSENIEKLRMWLKCWYGIDASLVVCECVQC